MYNNQIIGQSTDLNIGGVSRMFVVNLSILTFVLLLLFFLLGTHYSFIGLNILRKYRLFEVKKM